jgi:GTPase SAR1 family protein
VADSSFLGLFLLCAFAEDEMQLVVVGDQSSGKSSVLQAITKLPFPVDDKMCTRFPTEVALQRSAGPESISVQVKLALVENVGGYEVHHVSI